MKSFSSPILPKKVIANLKKNKIEKESKLIFPLGISVTGSMALSVSLSHPKPLDQSKNVAIRNIHIWSGSIHEQIFWR